MNILTPSTHAAAPAIPPASKPENVFPDTFEGVKIKRVTIKNFKSEHLNNLHDVDIFLPPQYDADDTTRYPVLYTIGWDSLFLTGSADPLPEGCVIHPENESMPSLLKDAAIRPFILVCVSPDLDKTVSLMDECAPTRVEREREKDGVIKKTESGGKVDLFAKFLIEEVKPMIDAEYRTLQGGGNTGITGISKWGMGTFYIAMNNPQVFGMVGGMSPALRWDSMVMAHILDKLPEPLPLRVWMGSGELEGHYLDDMSLFRRLFISKGIDPSDVEVLIVKDGNHSGQTWGPSVGPMLRFMFGVEE